MRRRGVPASATVATYRTPTMGAAGLFQGYGGRDLGVALPLPRQLMASLLELEAGTPCITTTARLAQNRLLRRLPAPATTTTTTVSIPARAAHCSQPRLQEHTTRARMPLAQDRR
jgi:hypothetical protein